MSAKAQLQYNKELGWNWRGWNRGVQKTQVVVWQMSEEVRDEVWKGVQDEIQEESENDGIRMVHLIDQKLSEVQRKVDRTDVMVQAMVRQGIRRWLQDTLERAWTMRNQRT